MNTVLLRSSLPAVGALFVAAATTPALAQVVTTPALIEVQVTLEDCGSGEVFSFLTLPPGAEGIYGGSASALSTPVGHPACWGVTLLDPHHAGGGSLPASSIALPNRLAALYQIPVEPYFGVVALSQFPFQDWSWYPFDVNATLSLANGRKTYGLEQLQVLCIGPLGSWFLPPAMVAETPGLLEISVACPGGSLRVQSASVVAKLNDTPWNTAHIPTTLPAGAPGSIGTVQATLQSLDTSSGGPPYPLHDQLLVRGNRSYALDVYYTTGTDPYRNRLNWFCHVDDTGPVAPCQKVAVTAATLTSCDPPAPGCAFGAITGQVAMTGQELLWLPASDRTVVKAYNGPLGNSRWAHAPYPNGAQPSQGGFLMPKVVPSVAQQGLWTETPYSVQGFMNFGQNSDSESFATPVCSPVRVGCGETTDLHTTFVMCPSHVTGEIWLLGPADNAHGFPPSALAPGTLVVYSSLPPSDPDLAGSSAVLSTGGSSASSPGGGAARVLFGGSATLGFLESQYSGRYDLRLAGLNSEVSLWQPNTLDLRFWDASSRPGQHLASQVLITENRSPQTSRCNESTVQDLKYCFGEVLITIENSHPAYPFTAVQVSGTGLGQPTRWQGPDYSVTVANGTGVVAVNSGTANEGLIRLFLPEGDYTLGTVVQYEAGWANQTQFEVSVNCQQKTVIVPGAPTLKLDGLPPCTEEESVSLSGTVSTPNPQDSVTVSYRVNSGNPVVLGSFPNGAISLPNIPVRPCENSIQVIATRSTGGPSVTTTLMVTRMSGASPTLSGCQDIVVNVPPGSLPVPVKFNVTAWSECPGVLLDCQPASESLFPLGTTPVTCVARDACGHTAACAFDVTVRRCATLTDETLTCLENPDLAPPTFTYTFTLNNPLGASPIGLVQLTPGAPCFTFTPGGGVPWPLIPPVPANSSGEFSTVLTVDGCPDQLCFKIALFDDQGHYLCTLDRCLRNPVLPRITCPSDLAVDCTDARGAVVHYPDPSATSLCCLPTLVECSPPSGALFPIGITTVTCTAADACDGTATGTFHVTVRGHGEAFGVWVKAEGGNSPQRANAIAVDAGGQAFVGGSFSGTATFTYPDNSVATLTSQGGQDAFLAKYDTAGRFLWVCPAGGLGEDQALGVAVDADGNAFVTGTFAGQAAFSGQTLSGSAGNDIFLAKYDPQGHLLWVVPAGGGGADAGEGVAVDAAGNCYLTGVFAGAAAFGGTPGSAPLSIAGTGGTDCFLAKYDAKGLPQWVVASAPGGSGNYSANARGVAVNADGTLAWITGVFSGTPQFGDTPALFPSTGWGNAFVAQLALVPTAPPAWAWARQTFCPSPQTDCGNHDAQQIGSDGQNNCYFTAYYSGYAAIGLVPPTPLFSVSPAVSGLYNSLVGSFDPAGTPRWLVKEEESGDRESRALAVNQAGDVVVAGFFHGANLSVDGGMNFILQQYNSSGTRGWSRYGIGASDSQVNAGRGVATDSAGCVYLAGSFTGPTLNCFGFPVVDPIRLTAPEGLDELLVAKYCPHCQYDTHSDSDRIQIAPAPYPNPRPLILSWPAAGWVLQEASSVLGPWNDVPGATSPYALNPLGACRFYRLRLGP